jgi:hypothetical protein
MGVPAAFREEIAALPPLLRALLEAELAAGNSISGVSHTFPAPPRSARMSISALPRLICKSKGVAICLARLPGFSQYMALLPSIPR